MANATGQAARSGAPHVIRTELVSTEAAGAYVAVTTPAPLRAVAEERRIHQLACLSSSVPGQSLLRIYFATASTMEVKGVSTGPIGCGP
jgi:hypothetical protein